MYKKSNIIFLLLFFLAHNVFSVENEVALKSIDKLKNQSSKDFDLFYEYHDYRLMMIPGFVSSSKSILFRMTCKNKNLLGNAIFLKHNGLNYQKSHTIDISIFKKIIDGEFYEKNYISSSIEIHEEDDFFYCKYEINNYFINIIINKNDTSIQKSIIQKNSNSIISEINFHIEIVYNEGIPNKIEYHKSSKSNRTISNGMTGINSAQSQAWYLIDFDKEVPRSKKNIFDNNNLFAISLEDLEESTKLENYNFRTIFKYLTDGSPFVERQHNYMVKSEFSDVYSGESNKLDFYFKFSDKNKYMIYDEEDTLVCNGENFYLSQTSHRNKYIFYDYFYKCFSSVFKKTESRIFQSDTLFSKKEIQISSTMKYMTGGVLRIERTYDLKTGVQKKCILLDSTRSSFFEIVFFVEDYNNDTQDVFSIQDYGSYHDVKENNFFKFSLDEQFKSREILSLYFLTYNECEPCNRLKNDLFAFLKSNDLKIDIIFINPINYQTFAPDIYRQFNKQDLKEEKLKFLEDYGFPTILLREDAHFLFYSQGYNESIRDRLFDLLKSK